MRNMTIPQDLGMIQLNLVLKKKATVHIEY